MGKKKQYRMLNRSIILLLERILVLQVMERFMLLVVKLVGGI
jgi:hypothetical protein